jgi:protein-S-isoprenylcysteine O-methyltransferase Ste14
MNLAWLGFALEVACWGSVTLLFIASAVIGAIRHPEPARTRPRTLGASLRISWWEVTGLATAILVLALVPSWVWQALAIRRPPLRVLGALLLLASTLLVVWTRLTLGRMWSSSARVRTDHELRTEGPYRVARHPMYTGFGGMVAGSGLMIGDLRTVVFAAVLLAVLFVRSRVEERLLIQAFGDRYLAYRREVGALLPLPWRRIHH